MASVSLVLALKFPDEFLLFGYKIYNSFTFISIWEIFFGFYFFYKMVWRGEATPVMLFWLFTTKELYLSVEDYLIDYEIYLRIWLLLFGVNIEEDNGLFLNWDKIDSIYELLLRFKDIFYDLLANSAVMEAFYVFYFYYLEYLLFFRFGIVNFLDFDLP